VQYSAREQSSSLRTKILFLLLGLAIVSGFVGFRVFLKSPSQQETQSSSNQTLQTKNIRPVANTVLRITKARLQLESADNVDRIRVVIGEGQNNGGTVKFCYEWFRNGKPFGVDSDSVTGFAKGDKIEVRITPSDDKHQGQSVMLDMTVTRVPPKVIEAKTLASNGDLTSYQVKAIDPNGSVLTYGLVDPPNDIVMDSQTGIVSWHTKGGETGKRDIKVSIKSASGTETIYPITVTAVKAAD
jgi:hypothetical protein